LLNGVWPQSGFTSLVNPSNGATISSRVGKLSRSARSQRIARENASCAAVSR